MTLLEYMKGLWTNLTPSATKTKLENLENGVKATSDILDLETDPGRAITQAANAAAQRTALGLGNVSTRDIGTGSGDVATGDAPAAAQAGAEATAATALTGHVSDLDPHTQYVPKVAGKGLSTNDYDDAAKTKLGGIEAGADVTDEANVTAIEVATAEVTAAPEHWNVLVAGAKKRLTHAGFATIVKAFFGFVANTVGFEIAGGATTSKKLTVDENASTSNIPTAPEKTRLGDIQAATGATTAEKIAALVPAATPTVAGKQANATSEEVTAGSVSNKSITPSALASGFPHIKQLADAEATQTLWNFTKAAKMPPNLLREIVETASAGAATVIHDDLGFPSMMYVIRGPILAGHIHADMGSVTGIQTATLGAGGSGYTANDLLTVVQAGASGGIYRALTVDGSGVVLTIQQVAPGTAYAVANGLATTGGTGTNATINVTDIGPVHNAFMVNGVDKMEILISMFKATSYNGTTFHGSGAGYRAISWPGLIPTGSLDFNVNKTLHAAKGSGWHMMSIWERALIMWLSMKMNTEPRGNTYYGRSHESGYEYECAVRSDSLAPGYAGGTAKHRNGSSPSRWSHNGERWGIYDLVGSMSEWIDLMKSVDGLIYMPNDNNFELAEASWPSTGVYLDNTAAVTGGAPRLNASRVNALTDPNYSSVAHSSMVLTDEYDALDLAIRQRMLRAGIATKIASGGTNPWAPKGTLYLKNYGERLPFCGGSWANTSDAGIAYLYLAYLHSNVDSRLGSRSAFISLS